jgi:hypothetical protein
MKAFRGFAVLGLLLAVCAARATAHDDVFLEGQGRGRQADGLPGPRPQDQGWEVFDRADDPAHAIFTGLGPERDQILAMDQAGLEQVFGLLGRTRRIPDAFPAEPCFGYASSLPGDSTVLLVRLDDCPEICFPVLEVELRRDARGLAHAADLWPSPAVHAGIATRSGLRLGLTRDQVKAVLGRPRYEDEISLHYGALYEHSFNRDEVLARGRDEGCAGRLVGVYRCIAVTFDQGRVSGLWVQQRIDWH